jgi:Cu2+-exporting ATPase
MALSKVQKETAAYKCPMNCEGDKTYTKAGKCPVCNMNLAKADTKKAATGHEGHNHN